MEMLYILNRIYSFKMKLLSYANEHSNMIKQVPMLRNYGDQI
jgi:hypothetical protein